MAEFNRWEDSLIIELTNGQTLSMCADPTKTEVLVAHIEDKQRSGDVCYFINAEGDPHAGIRGSHIKGYRFERMRKPVSPSTPQSEMLLHAHLIFKDGVIQLFESSLTRVPEVSKSLGMHLKAPVMDVPGIPTNEVVAYSLYAVPVCGCETQQLLANGCPSTKGERCVSRGKLVNGCWVVLD